MSGKTMLLGIVLVAVLAAIIWFGFGGKVGSIDFKTLLATPPKPPPLFPPLPPGEEKYATVETPTGPVTLVQRWDTSGVKSMLRPGPMTEPKVPLDTSGLKRVTPT